MTLDDLHRLPRRRAGRLRRRAPISRRSSAAPERVALIDGAPRPGRRPPDPRPQDDRARRRQPDAGHPLRPRRPPRRTSRSTSPSRSTWRRWPGTPTTAITPTPPATGSGCSTPGSTCPRPTGVSLTDEWLDLVGRPRAGRSPAGLWCFPIETVSQSEGGFEGVYQSSAVIPHWHVTADASGAGRSGSAGRSTARRPRRRDADAGRERSLAEIAASVRRGVEDLDVPERVTR